MKKLFIQLFSALVMVALTSLALTSCGSDGNNDDEPNDPEYANPDYDGEGYYVTASITDKGNLPQEAVEYFDEEFKQMTHMMVLPAEIGKSEAKQIFNDFIDRLIESYNEENIFEGDEEEDEVMEMYFTLTFKLIDAANGKPVDSAKVQFKNGKMTRK